MPPLFTIGIPTYNRRTYLAQSVAAALSQNYQNIQVLVCDNASTDDTQEFVRSIPDSRLKYVRNAENLGAQKNFERAVDLAEGEFFSWLQDDDLIFNEFASTAVANLQQSNSALFLGSALYSPTFNYQYQPVVYCPPLDLDWASGKSALVSGPTLLGLSLLVSVAIPPVVAFRTSVLRETASSLRVNEFPLFSERTILCEIAQSHRVIASPTIQGVFRSHPHQTSAIWMSQKNRVETEWKAMAAFLCSINGNKSIARPELVDCLNGVSDQTLVEWVRNSYKWPRTNALCCQMGGLLLDAARARHLVPTKWAYGNTAFRHIAKNVAPPVLLNVLRRAARSRWME